MGKHHCSIPVVPQHGHGCGNTVPVELHGMFAIARDFKIPRNDNKVIISELVKNDSDDGAVAK
eukprot:scaffold4052_cov213-Amphora_coffeaeformis.AAC.9